jgi:hypothetical protein
VYARLTIYCRRGYRVNNP